MPSQRFASPEAPPTVSATKAAEAASGDWFSRDLPIRGLEMKIATVRLGDLPRDMREELFNEHATNLDPDATERGFYAKRVPSGTIAIADLVIDAIPTGQLEGYTDPGKLPPIVIADGRLIDGQHRIARGRADGVARLRFIDVTGLIDTDAGGFVSELPRERPLDAAKAPFAPLAENGKPLTLFHGSPHAFEAFNAGEHGIFFAKRRDAAVAYAEGWEGEEGSGHVIAAQVSMHNPAIVDRAFLARFEARYPDDVAKAAMAPRSSLSFSDAFEDSESWARNVVVDQLRRAGHDGMVIPNDLLPVHCMGGDWELQPAYAVFSPEQIRRVPDPTLAAGPVDLASQALAFVASLEQKGPRP